jgi:uncharacterized damage-inducible protein DinB
MMKPSPARRISSNSSSTTSRIALPLPLALILALTVGLTLALVFASRALAEDQKQPPTPSQSINRNYDDVNRKVLDMAKDFPADKYSYRPAPGLRSFGEVILHISEGNLYAAKAGRDEKVEWVEPNYKDYPGKPEIVAALEKSIADGKATLNATPETRYTKTLSPWMGIIEHEGEHYGQLVVYYRNNGLVPPETRKPQQ